MNKCENLDGQCGKSWCNCDEIRKRQSSITLALNQQRQDMIHDLMKGLSRLSDSYKRHDDPRQYQVNQAIHLLWKL